MAKKKQINQNFYMIDGLRHQRITEKDRKAMSDVVSDYWKDLDYWYVHQELPDGRLYAGWGFRHPTKLTKDDLPPDYIEVTNYKKHGYIRTAGVKGLVYHPSLDHDHSFKDDFLYISYWKPLGHYVGGFDKGSTYAECDEYLFGWDCVEFIKAMERWSPSYDTSKIRQQMVDQYNAYCKDNKINGWEDLANGTCGAVRSDG